MTKYELVFNTREIPAKRRDEIQAGCTVYEFMNPELIKEFDSKAEALKGYKSDIRYENPHGVPYYFVAEYYVEKNEYDDEGEWESGGDIEAFSEMEINWKS